MQNGTYLLSRDGKGFQAFLGDTENEVTFDMNGRDIMVYNAGHFESGVNLKKHRENFLKKEAAWKAAHDAP